MVGQAGVHYVTMELLKVGIVSAEINVDAGYDIITEAHGVLKRCQVKAHLDGTHDRPELHQVRFNIRRRKAQFSGQNVNERRDKQYTADMIDVMICASIKFDKLYIVPAIEIDFTKDWLYARDIDQWEKAWHVLMTPTLPPQLQANFSAAQQEIAAT